MATTQRLTKAQKQEMTLGQLLDLQVQNKPDLKGEVERVKKRLATYSPEGTNLLDYNIKDLDDSPILANFAIDSPFAAEQRSKSSKRSGMLEVFNRLNAVFNDAGVKTYPNMQARLKEFLSEDQYLNETGYKYYRARRTLVSSPAESYKEIKQVLSSLEGEEKGYLGMKLFSGLRMTDFSKMQVENYDREKGRISFREGKSGQLKTVILRPGARPFFELLMGDRTEGPLVTNKTALDKAVNSALNDGVSPSVFEDIDGSKTVQKFSLRDLRNFNETILTEAGLSTEEQLFVGGRTPATEAAKYTKAGTAAKRVQGKLRTADALVVGYSETQDLGQYLLDVGIAPEKVPDEAKRVYVSANLLTDEDFLPALSDEFMQGIPDEGSGTIAAGQKFAAPDSELAGEYKKTAKLALQERRENITKAILKLREENQQRLLENPELAKPLEIETGEEAPKKAGTQPKKAKGPKDLVDKFKALGDLMTRGGKYIAPPLMVGATAAAVTEKAQSAEQEIEEGASPIPTYLRKGAEFAAEELTPIGIAEPVVEAGLEAGAEALQAEKEEKGLLDLDIEAQMGRMFGIPQ